MDSQNPYEAPKVQETIIPGPAAGKASLASILFAFDGRVPRRVYWGVSLGMGFIFYAALFALFGIFGEESPVAMIGALIMYIPLIWISFAIQIKRWHL